ncbi:helix-hairpin-helix domain-containing protein [Marivirga sp. S37H4]|uniref:Helix-hairpin-helix domain-containing protein n=1 Tax=Marivirga aurantiaca TaxID=2802615 RepID=A0A934X298_9BACT|nr:helix-hairpin-helix domain-containing protein [Marivirga aurantiaca]MBK6267005.1 helix-hairpin-helix domain-containing protein [Marivirga aurantiaca]
MWKAIILWLRNFFGFSRNEANGFVILLFLMIMVLFAPLISKQILLQNQSGLLLESDPRKLDSLLAVLDKNLVEGSKNEGNEEKYKLTDFDLNTVSSEKLQSFGLPAFLADRVLKYREMVKPFEKPEDFLKVYGIDSSNYLTFRPYIKIKKQAKSRVDSKSDEQKATGNLKDSSAKYEESNKVKDSNYHLKAFDINRADTVQLQKIYGIGSVFAQRIIEYRDLLGGFVNEQQLREVYGLKSPNLDSLRKYAKIQEPLHLDKLNINTLPEEELAKHPYISYKQAKLILAYREAHGAYAEPDDLLEIKILDSAFVKKIGSYLSFEVE